MGLPNPVIVLPGITASTLRDTYPVEPELVWGVLPTSREYELVTLHPDDLRYERPAPGAGRVLADSVFSFPYNELIDELRYNLTRKADQTVPVYPFAYDWRQPLEVTQVHLAAFVEEVIGRTKLLRHYHRSAWMKDPRVDLVGHSMGGLIIAGYLLKGNHRVGKVVTMGTPFRGSFEAPIKVATGTADFGVDSSSREREAARLTPALYYLLPDVPGIGDHKDTPPPTPVDFFNVDSWQPGVVETIREYVRLYGIETPTTTEAARARAREILRGMLVAARSHREGLNAAKDLEDLDLRAGAWLCIVGLGATTRVNLPVESKRGKPEFDLSSKGRLNLWSKDQRDSVATGDGTVPFLGACPTFLRREELVAVCPDDFGYWELRDRLLADHVVGFHGFLPKMNLIHRLIISHFTDNSGAKGLWGRHAPGATKASWAPPIGGLEDKDF